MFSPLLALCEGNPPVTSVFPSQRPVTQCFYVFFDLRLNKRLSKHLRHQWFEKPSHSLWRHCNSLHLHITVLSLGHHGISRHGQLDCLLNRLFRLTTKKHQGSTLLAHCENPLVHFPHKWPVNRNHSDVWNWENLPTFVPCVSMNLVIIMIISSCNSLLPVQHQTITCTKADFLSNCTQFGTPNSVKL